MASETVDLRDLPSWLYARAALVAGARLDPLLKVCRQLVIGDTKQNFVNQSDPDGTPWPARKRERKRNRGKGKSLLLRDTGLMMASATSPGAQGNVDVRTPTGLLWGSNLDRAGWHNRGTPTIPKRRFVGAGRRLLDKLDRAVKDFAAGLFKRK